MKTWMSSVETRLRLSVFLPDKVVVDCIAASTGAGDADAEM